MSVSNLQIKLENNTVGVLYSISLHLRECRTVSSMVVHSVAGIKNGVRPQFRVCTAFNGWVGLCGLTALARKYTEVVGVSHLK